MKPHHLVLRDQPASIRHEDTDYGELLMAGVDRTEARERVHENVERALQVWRTGCRGPGIGEATQRRLRLRAARVALRLLRRAAAL